MVNKIVIASVMILFVLVSVSAMVVKYYPEPKPHYYILTDDDREIDIPVSETLRLNCEMEEMSTKRCPTYSADTCIGESWFNI